MKKLLILLFVSQIVFGGSWRISLDPTHRPDFANLQLANDAAQVQNGDTLYIAGNPAHYPEATINKKLVIIGTGYFFNDNNIYNGTTNVSAFLDKITFADGSEGSVITSCEIDQLWIEEVEILIKRNWIYNLSLNPGTGNLIILQNYISGISKSQSFILNSTVIKNNHIASLQLSETNNTLVTNNTLHSYVTGKYLVFYNNILYYSNAYYNLTDCDVRNNLIPQTDPAFDPALGNQENVDMNEVFVSLTEGSEDARYMLKSGSPAIGAGVNGVDCGMFGGDSPYILSGLPAIPIIYELTIPAVGTIDNGLNVIIKARTNN
ncbi:MAG: hypothetical protein WC055_03265 [Melioribacteraceae bacterium]